ncbi:hypothetical protein MKX01_006756 [Papaver californicum]|nr:hypothetical protein MKX01_006756 [Papaver californicum]
MAGKQNHTIFIGALSPKMTQSDIHTIITDKHTGRPRGFAFLTYDDQHEAENAIMNMYGMALHGNVLTVNKVQNNMSGSDSGFGYRGYKDHGRTCYICGNHGHFYQDCPDLDSDDDEPGHFAQECNQGINPTPAEAAALLRQVTNFLKEIVVTAPQVKDSNGSPMHTEAVSMVRSVNPKLKETSDKVLLQVDSGKMASPEVPPRMGSGMKADPEVPPQVGHAKKTGPAVIGIFRDEDSEDMALKLENTMIINGFPVPNIYFDYIFWFNYFFIYEKHGHLAMETVIKNSLTGLFGLMVDLLAVITEMKETSHLDLTAPLLKHWMSKVSTAEAVKFNIGWLRTVVEEIDKYSVVYKVLHLLVKKIKHYLEIVIP